MTLRDTLLPLIDKLKKRPDDLGLRQFDVEIVKRTGGDFKGTLPTNEFITKLESINGAPYKLENVSQNDIARGLGFDAEIKITGITPEYTGGGFNFSDLEVSGNSGDEIFFKVKGPGYPSDGAWFIKTKTLLDKNFGYTIFLKRIQTGENI